MVAFAAVELLTPHKLVHSGGRYAYTKFMTACFIELRSG